MSHELVSKRTALEAGAGIVFIAGAAAAAREVVHLGRARRQHQQTPGEVQRFDPPPVTAARDSRPYPEPDRLSDVLPEVREALA